MDTGARQEYKQSSLAATILQYSKKIDESDLDSSDGQKRKIWIGKRFKRENHVTYEYI